MLVNNHQLHLLKSIFWPRLVRWIFIFISYFSIVSSHSCSQYWLGVEGCSEKATLCQCWEETGILLKCFVCWYTIDGCDVNDGALLGVEGQSMKSCCSKCEFVKNGSLSIVIQRTTRQGFTTASGATQKLLQNISRE